MARPTASRRSSLSGRPSSETPTGSPVVGPLAHPVASTGARSAAVARTSMAMPYGPSSRGVGTLRAGNSR